MILEMVICSELGKRATSEPGTCLFRADNMWWRYAQYFVIASYGKVPIYVYMAHVCFYVRCSDHVGVCGAVCYVAGVVKDSGCFEPCSGEVCCVFV